MEGCAEGDPGSKRAVAPLLLLMMMVKKKKKMDNSAVAQVCLPLEATTFRQ
jgi:hypothetical protein